MKMKNYVLIMIVIVNTEIHAAIDFNHCNALLEHGVNNITTSKSARHADAYNYHKYCKSSSYKQSDQVAASAHASIFQFGDAGGSRNTSAMKEEIDNWCKENEGLSSESSSLFAESRIISSAALSAWNSCQSAALKQVIISLKNQSENNEFMHFTVDSTSDGDIYLNSILQKGYKCNASFRSSNEAGSNLQTAVEKIDIGGYEKVTIQQPILIKNANVHVDCHRSQPKTDHQEGVGLLSYESGSIAINTSGPSFSIDVPKIVKSYIYTAPGAVVAYALEQCPRGWRDYKKASGRTIIGVGESQGLTKRSLNDIGGEEAHVLTESELASHAHEGVSNGGNIASYRVVDPLNRESGFHTAANHVQGWKGGQNFFDANDANYPLAGHTHNFVTNAKGGNVPHNNMQPYVALRYCIKN